MNFIDNIIEYFNPGAAIQRKAARLALKSDAFSLEAGSKRDRMGGWTPVSNSVNQMMGGTIQTVRNRSRDLIANNPYANKAPRLIAANMIGSGIKPQVKKIKDNSEDRELEELWRRWAESTKCDSQGQLNFYGIQGLSVKTTFGSGEIFIRRRRRRSTSGLELPFQLQLLEPEFLDITKDTGFTTGSNVIKNGIEYDNYGAPIFYHIYKEHPSENIYGNEGSVRVPAEDIIHLFRVDRPGQLRGIPWLTPAIVRIKDLGDYESTQLIRQKIAACFTAFVRDTSVNDAVAGLSKSEETNQLVDKLTPATIEILGPGRDVTFANPPGVGGDYDSYTKQILRGISVGTGLTYEALTNDYSNVNFSSGRMGWLEFQREIKEWQRDLIIMNLCARVWDWFLEYAAIANYNTKNSKVIWTPPRREMIDPANEINAMKMEVRAGFNSLSGAIQEQGRDPDEVIKSIKRDNERLDELGIIVDTDPRKISIAGQMQTENSDSNNDQTKETPQKK